MSERKDNPDIHSDFNACMHRDYCRDLKRQRDAAVEALRKLACLGNGDKPGNSVGNQIAIDALAEIEGKS